jgi:hypothetical protein
MLETFFWHCDSWIGTNGGRWDDRVGRNMTYVDCHARWTRENELQDKKLWTTPTKRKRPQAQKDEPDRRSSGAIYRCCLSKTPFDIVIE